MILTTAVALAAAAAPFAGGPNPTVTVDTFAVKARSGGAAVRHVVLGPESFSSNPLGTTPGPDAPRATA